MQQADEKPDYHREAAFAATGYVIGVDEAGRGPWAGPVCAAAFWIHPDQLDTLPSALTDSKKLTARKRAAIETNLISASHLSQAVFRSATDIDEGGLLPATFAAMAEAVCDVADRLLATDPLGWGRIALILVDGNLLPPLPYPAEAIIKGDSRSLSIAAASIIAKEARDREMARLHEVYPYYGWDSNQGYGTKAHQAGIASHGITPHHRRSFAPIKAYLDTAGEAGA